MAYIVPYSVTGRLILDTPASAFCCNLVLKHPGAENLNLYTYVTWYVTWCPLLTAFHCCLDINSWQQNSMYIFLVFIIHLLLFVVFFLCVCYIQWDQKLWIQLLLGNITNKQFKDITIVSFSVHHNCVEFLYLVLQIIILLLC